eukprot:g74724.t1
MALWFTSLRGKMRNQVMGENQRELNRFRGNFGYGPYLVSTNRCSSPTRNLAFLGPITSFPAVPFSTGVFEVKLLASPPDMGFCTKCGNNLGSDVFCGKCGTPAPTGEDFSDEGGTADPGGYSQDEVRRPQATQNWEQASTVTRRFQSPEISAPVEPVVEGLKALYKKKLLKIEEDFKFAAFSSPTLNNVDFDAKPMNDTPIYFAW